MSVTPSYPVKITGPQLRVMNDALSMILNDPDWADTFGQRDWSTLSRARLVIEDALRIAQRAESSRVS